MSCEPNSTPPVLDYASPTEGPSEIRGFWSILLASFAINAAASAWWQIGIRVGQQIEGQDVLFAPATGTQFWDYTVIVPPFFLIACGLVGLTLWCTTMMHLGRWGPLAPLGLLVALVLSCGTCGFNVPLVELASP